MSDHSAPLKSLVALKRQKAEQDVLVIQNELCRIEAVVTNLSVQLRDMDAADGRGGNSALARRHGHVEKLVADMARFKDRLFVLEAELKAARDRLRKVFYSEDRLNEV